MTFSDPVVLQIQSMTEIAVSDDRILGNMSILRVMCTKPLSCNFSLLSVLSELGLKCFLTCLQEMSKILQVQTLVVIS